MKDFLNLSYREIKEYIDKTNINKQELQELIINLRNDKRKNVISLGDKISRDMEKQEHEIKRLKALYDFDNSFGNYKYIAGVDEVGRGPLAGPIVAAAVILERNTLEDDFILGLNDSKKLSEKKREELAQIIKEKAVAYYISEISNKEIDTKGIAYANNQIFLNACSLISTKPELVLSDGYLVKNIKIENKYVIKGDTKSASIAAASIIAKVYRDNLMKEYSKIYTQYKFESNMGYGSKEHIEAIKEHGICEIHRKSFLTRIV